MTTEAASEEEQESGGALREKLEAFSSDNRALRETITTVLAKDFPDVKPEDLADVAPGELQERAAQVQEERTAARHEILRAELSAKGWSDEQVEEFLATPKTPPPQAQKPRFDGNVGTPPARPGPGEGDGLFGPSRIRAALGE